MPPALVAALTSAPASGTAPLPSPVAAWVEENFSVRASGDAEWSEAEAYLAPPRPGGDAWVAIARAPGAATGDVPARGWVSNLRPTERRGGKGRATRLKA